MAPEDRTYELDYGPPEPAPKTRSWRLAKMAAVVFAGIAAVIVGSLGAWHLGTRDGAARPQPVETVMREPALIAPPPLKEVAGPAGPRQAEDLLLSEAESTEAAASGAPAALGAVEGGDATLPEDADAAAAPLVLPSGNPVPVPVPRPVANLDAASMDTAIAEVAASAPTPTKIVGSALFTDCPVCPAMVSLPGGAFKMGSPPTETGRYGYEGPQRTVTVAAFAMGQREVTFTEWDACVADGGCRGYGGRDQGWGRGDRPALGISWDDAQAYAAWLSKKTGRTYRLPTEAEWEYAARAGTETAYWWGPNFDPAKIPKDKTAVAGAFGANPFDLADMLGNAREWVEDCYLPGYEGAPSDGRAVTTGDCTMRVIRGGSWKSGAQDVRSANRARIKADTRSSYMGFRVAASL